jgi:hypothetical protein
MVPTSERGRGGSELSNARIVPCADSSSNGGRPVSTVYKIVPRP